jgi:hypothetical protein
MYIRRTTIKSRASGEPYYTYRLVESVRSGAGVHQHTVLNLGRKFEVPRPQWAPLAQRIEALLGGQLDLLADGLDAQWEAMAQQYAARIVSRRGTVVAAQDDAPAPEGRLPAGGPGTSGMDLTRLYRVSDMLLAHRAALEAHLYRQERDLFSLAETITLYDLTNTFFEGTASGNPPAKRGHSQEKRTDCPLVTLALVLDASGFPKRSEVVAGNVSEPKTLEKMLGHLALAPGAVAPTVVLDAGIATEENLAWLTEQKYRYLVVSRERHQQFDPEAAVLIREAGDTQIRAQRVVDEVTGEVRLYCHSTRREAKERGIEQRFSTRLEAALAYLADGLMLPRRVKHYEKLLTRIGRLRQRHSRVARYYDIRLEKDEASGNATALVWTRIVPTDDTLPGVYWPAPQPGPTGTSARSGIPPPCSPTLEAVFRSLKSELGLRPLYHHQSARVDGHLFISVLAYHLVHSLRIRLKAQGIHLSWERLRHPPVRRPGAGHRRAPPRRRPDLPPPPGHPARTPPADPLQRPGPAPPARQRPRRRLSTPAIIPLKCSDQDHP